MLKAVSVTIGVLLSGLMLVSLSARAAPSPGFDCAKALSVDEKLICSDDKLAHADRSLAGFYRAFLGSLTPDEHDQLRKGQAAWIRDRNERCGIKATTEINDNNRSAYLRCFLKAYADRSGQLVSFAATRVDSMDLGRLRTIAEKGDVDAQAVLGVTIAPQEGEPGYLAGRRNPEESTHWLTAAAKAGQFMASPNLQQNILGLDSSPSAVICKDGAIGLGEGELSSLYPLLELEGGQPDNISFNCRETSTHSVVIGTQSGSNFGDVYLVTIENGKASQAKVLDRGHHGLRGLVYDQTGSPFIVLNGVYLNQGPEYDWYTIIDIRRKTATRILQGSDSPEEECEQAEADKMATANNIRKFHLELRSDGLDDLVFVIDSMNCHTHEVTAKTLRFSPTTNGLAQRG